MTLGLARLPAPALTLLTVLLLGLACSAPGSRSPDPRQVLRDAAGAMGGVRTVTADVKFGSGVQFQGVTLSSATSHIKVPDQSDTTFKVKQGDFLVDLRVITTGGRVYVRLPLASQYLQLDQKQAGEVPNLAQLLNGGSGLPALLPEGKDASYGGSAQVDGTATDRVDATYSAADVGRLLSGATPTGDVKASFWVGSSDHLIRRAVLALPAKGHTVSAQIDLRDFNSPVTVTPPAAVASPAAGSSPSPSP